ncbi:unnamed protein product [marine sediment metagenome]|uniref:Uncharacterized protein n=1 Tax=marine sediment metagenome TaxID=412755 RepID=X0XZ54_9ZZZZ
MTKIEFAEPIEVKSSENYLLIIRDANDVYHYWLPDGTYDGYDRPCKQK